MLFAAEVLEEELAASGGFGRRMVCGGPWEGFGKVLKGWRGGGGNIQVLDGSWVVLESRC